MTVVKKYTHLFFDLDNTLWDFHKNSREAMKAAFAYFNLSAKGVGFDAFFEVYAGNNRRLWKAYRDKEIRKKELTAQRFQLTFDELNIDGIEAQEMNDYYLSVMPTQKILIEGALEILNGLKNKRYRLYVITNGFKEVQYKKLESSGLAPFFEKVFVSEEVECPKPGKRIFEHAVKSANAKKSQSLMIGDDWEVDILGAANFGIDAVYFTNGNQTKSAIEEHIVNSNNKIRLIHKLMHLAPILIP